MHVVVGLGNPGARYEATRHNIGFMVLDGLAGDSGDWRSRSWRGAESHTALIDCGRREVLLVKPKTYMNRSGAAVASLRRELGFEPQDLLVVLDDLNLDFCRLRLRRGGGDGGHNGLASILQELATEEIPRLRLGIGRAPGSDADIDHVLADFDQGEDVAGLAELGGQAVTTWVREGIDVAMNRFNGRLPESD